MVVDNERLLLNVRSTKCVSFAQDDSLKVNRVLNIRPDKPCHKIRESLLSSATGSIIDPTLYRNIIILLLVAAVAHTALESVSKYGILFDPVQVLTEIIYKLTESPTILILLGVHALPLLSLGIEVMLSKSLLSENVGLTIIITLLTSEILIPAIIFHYTDSHAIPTLLVVLFVVCIFLKLVSYHVTNFWCREKVQQHSISSDSGRRKDIGNGTVKNGNLLIHYPDNLNFKDLCYFVFAPTLCYELNFPRSARIRKMFLIRRLLELIFLIPAVICFAQQCIAPTFNDSLKFFQVNDCLGLLEILLKLIVPYTLTIIIISFVLYHSYLNTMAEILRFGDRYFYNEFWNSGSVQEFYQNWNIPAHKWCIRHLYLPLRHCGFTNSQTLTATFFISAVFHEYFFIVSLKIFSFWSFISMIVQVTHLVHRDPGDCGIFFKY